MRDLDPRIQNLIKTVKKLIEELETKAPSQSNKLDTKTSIDPYAFDIVDMKGYSGQEYGGFPEPIMKMEDEF
jgi:hypothetical protein